MAYRRQPRDVEFGCYAERVTDYQIDAQYLQKDIYSRDLGKRRSVAVSAIFGSGALLFW